MIIGEHDAEFLDGPAGLDGKIRRIPEGMDTIEVVTRDLKTRKRYVYKPVKVIYQVADIIEEEY